MARIDASGAETGSINELNAVTIGGTGGTRTFTASTALFRSGTKSWRAEQVAPTVVGPIYGQMNFDAIATGCVRLSVLFQTPQPDNDGWTFLSIRDGDTGGAVVMYRVKTGGVDRWNLSFLDATGLQVGAVESVQSAAVGVWHDIYVRWNVGGSPRVAACSVDNGPEFTTTALAAQFPHTTLSRFLFGNGPPPAFGGSDIDVYFDDIIIDNTNAPIDHGRFLVGLTPSSDVQKQLLLPVTGTHFDDVNDMSDATAVATSIGGAEFDIYGLTDAGISTGIPAASITIPTVYGSIRAGSLTDTLIGSDQRVMLRLAGVDGTQAQPTVSVAPTTKRSLVVATTKPGGGNWTGADLDALQFKLGKQSGTLAITYTYQEAWATAEVAIQVNASEAASMAELNDVKNSLALTDSMSLSDTVTSITNRFEQIDTPTLVDIISSLKVSKDFADTVDLTDSITSIKNWIAASDSATLSEVNAIFVRAFVNMDDAFTLTDAVSSVKASLALTDTVSEAAIGDLMIFISYLLATGGGTVVKRFYPIFDD